LYVSCLGITALPVATYVRLPFLYMHVGLRHLSKIAVCSIGCMQTSVPLYISGQIKDWKQFLPHDIMRKRGLCCRPMSVRQPVTYVYCIQTT